MSYLPAISLAFLEITFTTLVLMFLHGLKKTIGSASFYLCLGMLFTVAQLVNSAQIKMTTGFIGWNIDVGTGFMLAPFMVALLIIYISDGTIEAQRMIFAVFVVTFAYIYISTLTAQQCVWPGYTVGDLPAFGGIYKKLFTRSQSYMITTSICQGIDMLVIPVIFQLFRNRGFSLFLSVTSTLIFTQVFDSFVFSIIMNPLDIDWWWNLRGSYIVRGIAMLWLSFLVWFYLTITGVASKVPDERSIFDIIAQFFRTFSKAKSLQQNISEWEGRYEMLVETSKDLIFIVDESGLIMDSNPISHKILKYPKESMHNFKINKFMKNINGNPFDWQLLWSMLYSSRDKQPIQCEWQASVVENIYFNVNISPVLIHEHTMVAIVCRDITDRIKFSKEREQLKEQMMTAQKIQAVGQLAGGIAHDFNNVLHSIQGNLDILRRSTNIRSEETLLVDNITNATNRVSSLTDQLLGFARKGKYNIQRHDIRIILEQVRDLFKSLLKAEVKFRFVIHPKEMFIKCSETQMEQVFLNILINAKDAIEKIKTPKITVLCEPAEEFIAGWDKKIDDDLLPEDYICVRVKDNGTGIPEKIKEQIFEPFFTTKEVGKGTGMGLAMSNGCIAGHNGWIHFETSEKGTEFFIFLPLDNIQ